MFSSETGIYIYIVCTEFAWNAAMELGFTGLQGSTIKPNGCRQSLGAMNRVD